MGQSSVAKVISQVRSESLPYFHVVKTRVMALERSTVFPGPRWQDNAGVFMLTTIHDLNDGTASDRRQRWIERIPYHIQEALRLQGRNEYLEEHPRTKRDKAYWAALQRERQNRIRDNLTVHRVALQQFRCSTAGLPTRYAAHYVSLVGIQTTSQIVPRLKCVSHFTPIEAMKMAPLASPGPLASGPGPPAISDTIPI